MTRDLPMVAACSADAEAANEVRTNGLSLIAAAGPFVSGGLVAGVDVLCALLWFHIALKSFIYFLRAPQSRFAGVFHPRQVLARSSARIPAFALSQRAYFGLPAAMTGVTSPGGPSALPG